MPNSSNYDRKDLWRIVCTFWQRFWSRAVYITWTLTIFQWWFKWLGLYRPAGWNLISECLNKSPLYSKWLWMLKFRRTVIVRINYLLSIPWFTQSVSINFPLVCYKTLALLLFHCAIPKRRDPDFSFMLNFILLTVYFPFEMRRIWTKCPKRK